MVGSLSKEVDGAKSVSSKAFMTTSILLWRVLLVKELLKLKLLVSIRESSSEVMEEERVGTVVDAEGVGEDKIVEAEGVCDGKVVQAGVGSFIEAEGVSE